MKHTKIPVKFEHYANPMVHPITPNTISSYKNLMNNPATAEVWQTEFGKDFGRMAQGDNKMGQKGTDAMFVMMRDEIAHALVAGRFFMYTNPVIDFCPQKDNPYRMQIMAGGNLITCNGNASVQTADLDTAVSSAQRMHDTCVSTSKTFISP